MQLSAPASYHPGAVHPTSQLQGLNGYNGNGTYRQYQDSPQVYGSNANYSHHPNFLLSSQVPDQSVGFVDQNIFMPNFGHTQTAETFTTVQGYVAPDAVTGASRSTNFDPPAALTRAEGGRLTRTSRPPG